MKAYRIVNRDDSQSLAEYLTDNGQILLPMVELIEGVADGDRRVDRRVGTCQYRGRVAVVGAGCDRREAAGAGRRSRFVGTAGWLAACGCRIASCESESPDFGRRGGVKARRSRSRPTRRSTRTGRSAAGFWRSSIPRKTSAEFWDIRISGCSRPNSTTWSLATIRQRWLN